MAVSSVNQVNHDDFNKKINIPQADNVAVETKKEQKQAPSREKNTLGQKFDNVVDKFSTNVKNSADLNDMVNVPRTIFKGYFAFMVGTTLMSVAAFLKKSVTIEKTLQDGNIEKITKTKLPSKILNISGFLIALFGTYNFVKPYLIKNSQKKQTNTPVEKTIETKA